MSVEEWHVDERVWRAYAAGTLDAVDEASVDAHITGCGTCRDRARALIEPAAMASAWEGIRSEISRPQLPRSLRWLRALGVPEDDLALLAASDGMLLPWAVTVGSAVVCAIAAGLSPVRNEEMYLLLAPLVPILAVVAAYDATDSLRTLVTATPYSKIRLAMLRTAAALVVALPATTAVGLGLPGLDALAFAWLLPALALTSTTLLLLTWLSPWAAAMLAGSGWVVVVVTATGASGVGVLTDVTAQVSFLALGLLMIAAFVLRSTSYRLLGGEG